MNEEKKQSKKYTSEDIIIGGIITLIGISYLVAVAVFGSDNASVKSIRTKIKKVTGIDLLA
jgi:hypothetical protein